MHTQPKSKVLPHDPLHIGFACGRACALSLPCLGADYVQRYAQPEHIAENGHGNGHAQDDDDDMADGASGDGFLSSSEEDEAPVTGAAEL